MRKSIWTSLGKQFAAVSTVLATSAFVVLSIASPALATPTGEFAPFADCPLNNAELSACLVAATTSGAGGEFTVGNRTVPIKNTITLQGGFTENRTTGAEEFVGAEGGPTLSKSPQKVPGGLSNIVNCEKIGNQRAREACEAVFENKLTAVYATTELAGPASSIGINEENLIRENGTALSLPLKVKLENPLFGEECYVGSNASPIVIELTTGTTSPPAPNKPIKGKKGNFGSNEAGTILTVTENSLVNNSFAAPKATGCGGSFSSIIDPIVNASLGLPAAAGHNAAILDGALKQAGAETVREN